MKPNPNTLIPERPVFRGPSPSDVRCERAFGRAVWTASVLVWVVVTLTLLFVAGCASPPQPPVGPPVVIAGSPVVGAVKRAVIIGINAYGHGNDLYNCVNDLKVIDANARAAGWEIKLLADADATAAAIRDAADALRKATKAGDTAMLVFSGHGTQLADPADPDGMDEAIVPVDVFDGDFAAKCIKGSEMRVWLQGFPAGSNVILWLDSCHSGTRLRKIDSRLNRFLPAPPALAPKPAHLRRRGFSLRDVKADVVLAAGCKADQLSADGGPNGEANGAFTAAMAAAGVLDAVALGNGFDAGVKMLADARMDQTPQLTATTAKRVVSLLK